jgi:UDP-N-acetylmuramoyl-L-alanyl-D-glutamate--2,6-diaminopimelate ligase
MPRGACPTSRSKISGPSWAPSPITFTAIRRALFVVGVTGTNGKTSCTHWIAQCLEACGRKSAILGTLGNGLVGALDPSARTTPDAAEVHAALARLRDAGAAAVAMEVSSHGLEQGRVNAVEFDVALFTNLTRDHLDYHGTMAAYAAAKAGLFAWPTLEACVINADDPFGRTLADTARARGQRADLRARQRRYRGDASPRRSRSQALDHDTWGRGNITPPLSGTFKRVERLGRSGRAARERHRLDAALASLARVTPPPGRMQRWAETASRWSWSITRTRRRARQGACRSAARRQARAERICVFGCGGERDRQAAGDGAHRDRAL